MKANGFFTAGSAGMRPAATDDWATPQAFFDVLNAEFAFTLDVSASSGNHKTAEWFGFDHPDPGRRNALDDDWAVAAKGGTVFMNPPYGRTIGRWTAKAAATAAAGTTVVCVLPARTDTRWFQDCCVGHELRFVRGRLRFGAGIAPAPFPSVVVVMRPPDDDDGISRYVYTVVVAVHSHG